MEVLFLKPDASYEMTQELRKKVDCILIDKKKLSSNDSFIVDDESFDFRLQPLRLVVTNLSDLDHYAKILNDRFKRNTMIVAPDDEVKAHPEVVLFLESQGVALLMTKRDEDGLLSYDGLMRSLTSLRFKSILVEDKIDMIKEFNL